MFGRVGSGHLCGCNENLDCISRSLDDFVSHGTFDQRTLTTRSIDFTDRVSFIFRWFKPGKCSFSTNPWCQMQLYSLLEAFIKVTDNLVAFQGEDHVLLWVFSAVVCSVTSSSTMKYISYFNSRSELTEGDSMYLNAFERHSSYPRCCRWPIYLIELVGLRQTNPAHAIGIGIEATVLNQIIRSILMYFYLLQVCYEASTSFLISGQ